MRIKQNKNSEISIKNLLTIYVNKKYIKINITESCKKICENSKKKKT